MTVLDYEIEILRINEFIIMAFIILMSHDRHTIVSPSDNTFGIFFERSM